MKSTIVKVKEHNRKSIIIISTLVVGIIIILLIILLSLSNASREKTKQQIRKAKTNTIKNVHVGDIVIYGVYDKTPLEWQVLYIKKSSALLITNKCISQKAFNNQRCDNTWENSTLREWLNNDFIESFSKAQLKNIKKTTITDQLNEQEDKFYLLSVDEANQYFSDDGARIARNKYNAKVSWWLRSPSPYDSGSVQVVTTRGYVTTPTLFASAIEANHISGVRPAFWLNL